MVDAPALAAYADEIVTAKSRQEASIYLTPVRGLFLSLVTAGVLAEALCPAHWRRGRRQVAAVPEPNIPLAELREIVRSLDNWGEDSKTFQAGLVVLAPLALATLDPVRIATFTEVPEPLVRQFATRLLASRVWLPGGWIAAAAEDPESGEPVLEVVEVILNVLIAVGKVECRPAADGDWSAGAKLYAAGSRRRADGFAGEKTASQAVEAGCTGIGPDGEPAVAAGSGAVSPTPAPGGGRAKYAGGQ